MESFQNQAAFLQHVNYQVQRFNNFKLLSVIQSLNNGFNGFLFPFTEPNTFNLYPNIIERFKIQEFLFTQQPLMLLKTALHNKKLLNKAEGYDPFSKILANTENGGSKSAHSSGVILNTEKKLRPSKKIRKTLHCEHSHKEHYAKGLCNNCYHRFGRTKAPSKCPHKRLYAHGLCQNCYINQYNRQRRIDERSVNANERKLSKRQPTSHIYDNDIDDKCIDNSSFNTSIMSEIKIEEQDKRLS